MTKKKEEKESMDLIISNLEKKYGVTRKAPIQPEVVDSGSLALNQATGINGIPLGKMIEIFGMESGGKTSIALHTIAQFQKNIPDKKVALLDFEHSFDKKYATSIGVNVDDLLIYQPDNMENGYDLILALITANAVSLVVLDSQTAALPKAIIDGDIGDATIGLAARVNSKFCGKVKGLLDLHKTTLMSISQTRANIGGMSSGDVSTGGNAWKFYADMRWKVWKLNDKENDLNKTTIDIIKNKLAPPFGQAKINVLWGIGYDTVGEIVNYGIEFGLVKKGGAWFSFNDERYPSDKFQGMENMRTFLMDNPELLDFLKNDVLKKLEDAS